MMVSLKSVKNQEKVNNIKRAIVKLEKFLTFLDKMTAIKKIIHEKTRNIPSNRCTASFFYSKTSKLNYAWITREIVKFGPTRTGKIDKN